MYNVTISALVSGPVAYPAKLLHAKAGMAQKEELYTPNESMEIPVACAFESFVDPNSAANVTRHASSLAFINENLRVIKIV